MYRPDSCLDLLVEVGAPVDLILGGEGSPAARCSVLQQVMLGLRAQHCDLLLGPATSPPQSSWPRLRTLRCRLRQGNAAVAACQAAVQAQGLEVQLEERTVTVPVQPVAARLPPGCVTLEMRGVPDDCARHGFTAALIAAAGYGEATGVSVVHERASVLRGPTGETIDWPVFDMVVAVVAVPSHDPSLRRLPAAIEVGGSLLTIVVKDCLSPPSVRLTHRPAAAREAGSIPRQAVLERVAVAHGLTPAVRASGAAPVAEEAAQRAQRPGCRAGLGFSLGGPPSPPLTLPDMPMTDALPPLAPPTAPTDEPIFGAAVDYLQDHSDLQQQEIERVVLAFRAKHPGAYQASLGASTASSLPQDVRGPLHDLARAWFGERGGGATAACHCCHMGGYPACQCGG